MLHIPVLLKESIEKLSPKEGEFFIDCTGGGGGHSREILKRIGKRGKLLVIDWDKNNVRNLKEIFKDNENVFVEQANYKDAPELVEKNKLGKADGLIIDLGFSTDQIEEGGRGFSFLKEEILDMRYELKEGGLTAAEVVNQFSEKDLADIFYKYGEERYSRQIAKNIVESRRKKRILMTFDLVEIIRSSVPKKYERGRINPATRVFQALRIYVNDELGNLEEILKNLRVLMNKNGRVAIISFHSLEDRIVKNYFREMVKNSFADFINKKPIVPTDEEILNNPKSRSAKMRAIRVIAGD